MSGAIFSGATHACRGRDWLAVKLATRIHLQAIEDLEPHAKEFLRSFLPPPSQTRRKMYLFKFIH